MDNAVEIALGIAAEIPRRGHVDQCYGRGRAFGSLFCRWLGFTRASDPLFPAVIISFRAVLVFLV